MDDIDPTEAAFSSLEAEASTLATMISEQLNVLRNLDPADAPPLASEIAEQLGAALDELDTT